MTQVIQAAQSPAIEHGVLIDLSLPDPITGTPVTYHISNCYTNVTYNSISYTALGGFLTITDIQGDLQSTNNEITLSLSAIPSEFIESIMGHEIKGGSLKIYRAFFDSATQQVKVISGQSQVFLRFDGIISNYAIQEDVSGFNGAEVRHTITVTASSILSVLENRVSGRRTNDTSYQKYFGELYITNAIINDPSMSKVVALRSATFDFGKKV